MEGVEGESNARSCSRNVLVLARFRRLKQAKRQRRLKYYKNAPKLSSSVLLMSK